MALHIDVAPDDVLQIGENTFVTVEKKSGRVVRLSITGDERVELLRARRAKKPLNPPATATGD